MVAATTPTCRRPIGAAAARSCSAALTARARAVASGEQPGSTTCSYERVGAEMLFELVAVCDRCHASIHDKSAA